ncbi:hypothetical protein KKG90_02610 [Candidatus Bipolaricaulota bacterium]|nr:hypothetical protein [Candidatus Bipolaricaulota bacterium]
MRSITFLLCVVALSSVGIFGQSADWTIWNMPSDKSFPGDLAWMIDNSLFVVLHEPEALARFEPDHDRLLAWTLPVPASEFVLTNSGLFFTAQRDASIGWLQPDANHIETWPLPSPTAEPIFLRESSFGDGVENCWYLDWELGRLGLFEPEQLTSTFLPGTDPVIISVTQTTRRVVGKTQAVDPALIMGEDGFAPATYLHLPVETDNYREWGLVTMDPPAYALAEDVRGQVWIPDAVNGSLLALSPSDNVVRVYGLPDGLWIGSLAPIPRSTDIYFSAHSENDGVSKIGLLQPETGNVALWNIPGGSEIDAISLLVVDDALWFCDRGHGAVYRFELASSTFTWWETGGDDSPLYIVAGYPGEFWVSWEWSGKIARLRLPSE